MINDQRKLILLVSIVLLCAVSVCIEGTFRIPNAGVTDIFGTPQQTPKVTLISPYGNEQLIFGNKKNIVWSYTGPHPETQKWKILIRSHSKFMGTIARNVSGDRYFWNIGDLLGGNLMEHIDLSFSSSKKEWTIIVENELSPEIQDESDVPFFMVWSDMKNVNTGKHNKYVFEKISVTRPQTIQQKSEAAGAQQKTGPSPDLTCSITASHDRQKTRLLMPASAPVLHMDPQLYKPPLPDPWFIYFFVEIQNFGQSMSDDFCVSVKFTNHDGTTKEFHELINMPPGSGRSVLEYRWGYFEYVDYHLYNKNIIVKATADSAGCPGLSSGSGDYKSAVGRQRPTGGSFIPESNEGNNHCELKVNLMK